MLFSRSASSDERKRCEKAISYQYQSVTIETTATGPTVAVIAQTYDSQWRASVDGQPAKLLRANHAFQAVAVPEGQHTLRLVYVDRSFKHGAIISLFGLADCLLAWLLLGGRRAHKFT